MKLIAGLVCAGGLWAGAALAQTPVTLTIDVRASGAAIPANFVGLSFGMKTLLPNKAGARLFSDTNTSLVTLFQNLGIRHLRVGGTTVESPPATPVPGERDIDNLFDFAWAAGVQKIIYSFRLLETDPTRPCLATNSAIAKYIRNNHLGLVDCFAIGNEPDLQRVFHQDATIRDFATYLDQWRKYAAAIKSAFHLSQAIFAGPDAGSGNITWTTQFARAEKNSGLIKMVTEHYYPGGKGKGVEARQGIEDMLSPAWVKANQTLYDKMAAPVLAMGLPFRFTEANDHYSGGIRGASDTFAGALWALDFLHWWAAHDASGVDFHNTTWVASDIITPDTEGGFKINPKGYGLKAFDLGSHGSIKPVVISTPLDGAPGFIHRYRGIEPVAIANPDAINLTAYAVRGAGNLFVTIINKDHGPRARAADVTIVSDMAFVSDGLPNHAGVIFLTAPDGNVAAKTGVTLGGASINNDGPWLGKWTPLASDKAGRYAVKVAAASAAIVKIEAVWK